MLKWYLSDDELRKLDKLAHKTIAYLVFVGLASFFGGMYALGLSQLNQIIPNQIIPISLIGVSGSAIAALTSCLDRYSMGFERENGEPYPPEIKQGVGKFNRRFAWWLFARPCLGAVIAPVFILGIKFFDQKPEDLLGPALGFTAFMAGLLAKSVVDLIKGLFKNIFKT